MYFVTIKIFGRQNVYISKNLSLAKIRERFYLFVKQRRYVISYAFIASSTATAQATVAPTIGLLPISRPLQILVLIVAHSNLLLFAINVGMRFA